MVVEDLRRQSLLGARGVLSLYYALRYLKAKPALLKYIFLSIVLNFLVFLLVIGILFTVMLLVAQALLNGLQVETSILAEGIISLALLLAAVAVAFLGYTFVSSAINAPIYSALAEKVLDEQGVLSQVQLTGRARLRQDISRSLEFEFKKLTLSGLILIFTFVVNLIPFIGNLAYILINGFQIVTLSGLDILEPAMAREGVKFRHKLKFIYSNPGIWPFILSAGFLNSIPVVNLIFTPLNIIGGLLLYSEVKLASKSD